jgi:hypothetical protein
VKTDWCVLERNIFFISVTAMLAVCVFQGSRRLVDPDLLAVF